MGSVVSLQEKQERHEEAFVQIPCALTQAMARTRIAGEQMQCLWVILEKTRGGVDAAGISIQDFVRETGMARQSVQRAITGLENRRIIVRKKAEGGIRKKADTPCATYLINNVYAQWEVSAKKRTPPIRKKADTPYASSREQREKQVSSPQRAATSPPKNTPKQGHVTLYEKTSNPTPYTNPASVARAKGPVLGEGEADWSDDREAYEKLVLRYDRKLMESAFADISQRMKSRLDDNQKHYFLLRLNGFPVDQVHANVKLFVEQKEAFRAGLRTSPANFLFGMIRNNSAATQRPPQHPTPPRYNNAAVNAQGMTCPYPTTGGWA